MGPASPAGRVRGALWTFRHHYCPARWGPSIPPFHRWRNGSSGREGACPRAHGQGNLGDPWSGYLTTVTSAAFPRSLPQKLLFPFRDLSGLGVLTPVWIWDELMMESKQGDSFFSSGDSGQEAGPQGS